MAATRPNLADGSNDDAVTMQTVRAPGHLEAIPDDPPTTSLQVKNHSVVMDQRIWNEFPADLVEIVLAAVPTVTFFQARVLCKRFNELLFSRTFLRVWTKLHAPEDWLLMVYSQFQAPWMSLAAYNPCRRKWFYLPTPRSFFSGQSCVPMASSQGLICMAPVEESQHLILWNPLTNSAEVLRGMLIKKSLCVGLAVNPATKAYQIVLLGYTSDSSEGCVTEVYDSSLGHWKRADTSHDSWHGCYSDSLVYFRGAFHVISANQHGPFRLCLISYDLKEGFWRETCKLPTVSGLSFCSPSLFEVKPGRLFLAVRNSPDHNQHYAIHLWELRVSDASVDWIMVAIVPQEIIELLRKEHWGSPYFRCHAIGDLVCFVGTNDFRGFVYDLSWEEWHWLPRRLERLFDHLLSFQPRLDMLNC